MPAYNQKLPLSALLTDNERYQHLRALEQHPNLTQRQLAIELG